LTSSITRALNLPTTARSRLARTRHVLCADFCLHGRPSWRIGSCLCLAACTALELCSSATPPHPAAPAFFHHVSHPSRGEHLGARLTTLSQHHPPSSDTPLSPTRASIRPGGRPAGSRLSWLGLSLVPELPGSRCSTGSRSAAPHAKRRLPPQHSLLQARKGAKPRASPNTKSGDHSRAIGGFDPHLQASPVARHGAKPGHTLPHTPPTCCRASSTQLHPSPSHDQGRCVPR